MQNAPTLTDPPARPIRSRLRWVGLGVAVAVLIAAAFALYTRIGWAAVHDWLLGLDPLTSLIVLGILPLLGFSIVAVYLVIGAKFGVAFGALAVVAITAFHLAASHLIARSVLRAPLQRYLQRHQKRLPVLPLSDEAAVAVLLALVPGLPYFARNYILALSEIPLRVYFWICLPIYVIRSYVTLSLGDWSGELTRSKIVYLVCVYAVKLSISAYLLLRVRKRLKLSA